MLFEGYVAAYVAKTQTALAERRAAENFRFRNHSTPESKALTAAVTTLLALFVR